MNETTGAVILAGGHSERMNFPKAFLGFEGKPFIQYLAETYILAGISRIALVINHRFCTPAWRSFLDPLAELGTLVPNGDPDKGRMHSIRLGLQVLNGVNRYFLQPTDTPLMPDTVKAMLAGPARNGYVVPVHLGQSGHPVLISKRIANTILARTETSYTLRQFLSGFDRNVVEVPDERILWNINTPDEYKSFTATEKMTSFEGYISKNK